MLEKSQEHPEIRKALIEMCSKDILFYTNSFIWQYNPDHPTRLVAPFVTRPKQEEVILKVLECIKKRKDLIIEKSRYQGASWIVDICFDWLQRFHPWTKTHMISRVADLVDSVKDESLFWKLDFIDQYMPGWMKMRCVRQSMYRKNLDNNAIISGEATTGKAGVGARATIMFIDEFAQIREDFEVLHRTTETTHCRIFVSTHVGQDTAFFQICQSGAIEKIQMHWTDNPEQARGSYIYNDGKIEVLDKTYQFPDDYRFVMDGKPTGGVAPGVRSPYYDEQCERKGSARAVAMDLDIDPEGSVSQFFDPITVNNLRRKYCCKPYLEGDVIHDEDGNFEKFVPRPGGTVKLWTTLGPDGLPPAGRYGAGADISTGEGATPSCFSVGNVDTGDKVLEIATSRIRPVDFAALCVALCRWFHDVLLCWEQQGPGTTFGKRIVEMGYGRIHYKSDDLAYGVKPTWHHNGDKPGWYPSPAGKRFLLEQYANALTKYKFFNRSDQALKECLAFKFNDRGTPEHAGEKNENPAEGTVNHGDRVVADALCYKMMVQIGRPKKEERKDEKKTPVLSLAWRRQYHEQKEREALET